MMMTGPGMLKTKSRENSSREDAENKGGMGKNKKASRNQGKEEQKPEKKKNKKKNKKNKKNNNKNEEEEEEG